MGPISEPTHFTYLLILLHCHEYVAYKEISWYPTRLISDSERGTIWYFEKIVKIQQMPTISRFTTLLCTPRDGRRRRRRNVHRLLATGQSARYIRLRERCDAGDVYGRSCALVDPDRTAVGDSRGRPVCVLIKY